MMNCKWLWTALYVLWYVKDLSLFPLNFFIVIFLLHQTMHWSAVFPAANGSPLSVSNKKGKKKSKQKQVRGVVMASWRSFINQTLDKLGRGTQRRLLICRNTHELHLCVATCVFSPTVECPEDFSTGIIKSQHGCSCTQSTCCCVY